MAYFSSYLYLKYKLNNIILLGGGIRNIGYSNQMPVGYRGSIRFLSNKKIIRFYLAMV